ncbi:MAG: tetratricopeptide repeat protein [Planctomycetota bacterium]
MANKGRKKRRANSVGPASIWQNLEKGNAKAALKQAKVRFRGDASHDNRQLLEHAFLARIEQLHKLNKAKEAKAALKELLDLGPEIPPVVERLPRLQVILGEEGVDPDQVLESDPSLLNELIDQAILDEQRELPDHADIQRQVTAVREALAAVEQGEDEAANRLLADISRNSPVADWRLFARGLSAFYQQDAARAKQNWSRLDATRPGHRIARTLLVAAGMAPEENGPDLATSLHKLEQYTQSAGVVDRLKRLAEVWREERIEPFFRQFRKLRQQYFEDHEELIRRIVELVWKRGARDGDERMIDRLASIGPPPPLDPHWWRATALAREHGGVHDAADSCKLLEAAWNAYAKELPELEGLRESDRPIAVALVYNHLGTRFLQEANQVEKTRLPWEGDQADKNWLRQSAGKYFRNSISAYPELKDSYYALVKLHEEDEEIDKAARVMEKLAAADPDCFDAADWLANYYLSQDNPRRSEPHVNAVKRLRPRDPACATLAWKQAVTAVRCATIKRQFEAARREVEQAAAVAPPDVEPYTLDLLRAGIEFKAKNVQAANAHVQTAVGKVEDPTPIWMQMSATAARMRVAREFKKEFDNRFKADIQKKPNSVSAGRMARFLHGIKASKANYTGRATQEKSLVKYLERAVHVEWNDADLRYVCYFLQELARQQYGLWKDFIHLGRRCFPETPHYHFWTGVQQYEHGPYACDAQLAIRSLQQAIDLQQQSQVKLNQTELERAKSLLSLIKEREEEARASWFAPEYFEDDEDDEYDEDDIDDGIEGGALDAMFRMLDDADDEDLFGIEKAAYAKLVDSMPPHLRDMMEMFARTFGLSVEKTVQIVLQGHGVGEGGRGEYDELDDMFDFGPATATKKKSKRKKKSGRRKSR